MGLRRIGVFEFVKINGIYAHRSPTALPQRRRLITESLNSGSCPLEGICRDDGPE